MKPAPVFIVAKQRSGTNFLRSKLVSSGQFEDFDEIFHHDLTLPKDSYFLFRQSQFESNPNLSIPTQLNQGKLFDKYIEHIQSKSNQQFVLLDIKYNSLGHFNPIWHFPDKRPYLFKLIKERNYKVVHLVRKNVLHTHISERVANKNTNWHVKNSSNKELRYEKIELSFENLIKAISNRVKEIKAVEQYLKHLDHCQLYYEELGNEGYLSDVLNDYLGVGLTTGLNSKYKKILPNPWELVSNAQEIIDKLSRTDYKKYI